MLYSIASIDNDEQLIKFTYQIPVHLLFVDCSKGFKPHFSELYAPFMG